MLRFLKAYEGIRTEFKDLKGPVSDETLTGGIIRMMSHYRENKKTIRTMILVCTLGGFCFLVLGVLNSLEFFSFSLVVGQFHAEQLPPDTLCLS